MDKKTTEQIEYEDRLRYRLKILNEHLDTGKVKIVEGLNVAESLKAIRYGSNGKVDLDTVDGLVRSLALAVEGMHHRQETKQIATLFEIQNNYFEFLDTNFSAYYDLMIKDKSTPHKMGSFFSSSQVRIDEVKKYMYKVLEYIDEFWNNLGDIAQIHVEDMHNNIKGVFGGDLFPSHSENLASKCGIYTDTIILPDPFLRTKHIFGMQNDSQNVYYFMKHVMNLLQYKDLACAKLDIPIVVVLPDNSVLDSEEKEFNMKLGEEDSLIHYAKLFGRQFESFEELMDFSASLDTLERALLEIKDPERLLFDCSYGQDPKNQLQKMQDSSLMKNIGMSHPGEIIANMSLGRMATANELLIKSRRLGGVPILDAPTSWQYFKWKLEYDSKKMESITSLKDLHINKALQGLAGQDMQWIGNIPPQALIEIRREGAMDEIRHIISTDIHKLIELNPNSFHRTQDQIFENLQDAFRKHQENLKNLSTKKWKFAGQDFGSWLVIGGIEVSAALTGTPLFGLASWGAGQLFDTPKIKDFPKTIKALQEENDKVKKSPVGMLFNIRKKLK